MTSRLSRVMQRPVPAWLQLALCLAFGMALSLIDRTDANWDLQNYHLYDPWALLHGRLSADYYAAGYQSYFNPLADLPYFLAKCVLAPTAPRLVALLAGLPYGLMLFLVLRLSAQLLLTSRWPIFLAAAIGLTGATTLSEVGTSYDDILAADFILGALLCLLKTGHRPALAAGLLCGIGVALKLTAGLFAIPLGLMLLCLPGSRATRSVLFATGAALGFLAAYGWWGWRLWHQFGNPFHPLFGNLFPGPWAMPHTGQDARFFPKTLLQWLAYPFFWLQGRDFIVSELKLRDPRFALAYLAVPGAMVAVLFGRLPRRSILALWLFMASGYLFWLCGFSILRYALPLEVLTGIFIATILQALWPRHNITLPLALLAIFCLAFTKPMGWGRISYGKSLIAAPLPTLPAGTILFTAGAPVAFVTPYLNPAPSHIIQLGSLFPGTPEWLILQKLLRPHPPVWLLTNARRTEASALSTALSAFNLQLEPSTCLPVHSQVQKTLELCPLTAAAPS